MEEVAAVKTEVRRSSFYAHLYLLTSESEVPLLIKHHKTCYRKAAHHCSAAVLSDHDSNRIAEISKNDGEVGHPGKALFGVLHSNGLSSHMLIVSRVYGGTKLGPGGVTRAFKEAGEGAGAGYLNPEFSGASSDTINSKGR